MNTQHASKGKKVMFYSEVEMAAIRQAMSDNTVKVQGKKTVDVRTAALVVQKRFANGLASHPDVHPRTLGSLIQKITKLVKDDGNKGLGLGSRGRHRETAEQKLERDTKLDKLADLVSSERTISVTISLPRTKVEEIVQEYILSNIKA